MTGNPLAGLPLRYLIGKNDDPGIDGYVTEVGYDAAQKPAHGIGIKYCNLFDEKRSGLYPPYLKDTGTSAKYGEGVIDPFGEGWKKNLEEQFTRAQVQRFAFVELDNPDAYHLDDVLGATSLAQTYGLGVIAKNPLAMDEDATTWLKHANVFGVIVENGDVTARQMHDLRTRAGKPDLPVWFVAFNDGDGGWSWATRIAVEIAL